MLKKDLTEEKFKEMLEKSYLFTVSDAVVKFYKLVEVEE